MTSRAKIFARKKMKIKNETEIQLMKILFKMEPKKRLTKNVTSRKKAYPYGLERKFYSELKSFFKPLIDYVNGKIFADPESLLRGDSVEIKTDSIPGPQFRQMGREMENWMRVNMPNLSELPDMPHDNVIFMDLDSMADEVFEFQSKELTKSVKKGINVTVPISSPWWNDMKKSWMETNYILITSNARNFVSKINTLTEQAIVSGWGVTQLKKEIMKATESLSDKHCKLLARDQIGKLNGRINQNQMQEIGLDLYVWDTSHDDRVRESHALMQGLLCRWDDANLCSYDNGKTWEERPSGAVRLHPGEDIQCRCSGLVYFPELIAEVDRTASE